MSRSTLFLVRTRSVSGFFSTGERDRNIVIQLAEQFPDLNIISVPFLYDLEVKGSTVQLLCGTGGDSLVLSPIASRAAYGILNRLGIECSDNYKGHTKKDRTIICRQVQIIDKDTFVKEVESFMTGRTGQSFSDEERMVEYIDEETNEKWYPVLDVDACLGCLECVGFCLFGVYTVNENNRPEVSVPDACRNGCPACARVCPGGAIMFPLHNDPAINGELSAAEVQKENQNKNDEKNIAALLPSELEEGTRRNILNGLSDELDELVNQTEDF